MTQPRDFGFGDDEKLLRDSARRFLSDNFGETRLRALVAPDHREAYEAKVPPLAYDPDLWDRMVELGWSSLPVPSAHGGAGMKMVALVALAEEIGRFALPSPLEATWWAACVLRECPGEAAGAWLQRIAEGAPASPAVPEASPTSAPGAGGVRAETRSGAVYLRGEARFVQDARKAAFFVVVADSGEGTGIYVVPRGAAGVNVRPDRIVDLTRDQARIELDGVEVPAEGRVAPPGSGAEVLRRALPAVLTILSADMCGAGEWQLQTTAEYARTRRQFDRPIGFFQAVKHPIVDMMIAIDRARALTWAAACALDTDPADAPRLAHMAKAAASDMADFCSGRSVQVHGGIGFTWECTVHIYFKRQKHSELLFGDGTWHRARLAEYLDTGA